MERVHIEASGCILKEEQLTTLDKNIIKGTMVLETVNPFSGYYSDDPEIKETIPNTIFFILDDFYYNEDIARATKQIHKYFEEDFDAVRADITIYNTVYSAIRLYDVKNYEIVLKLQQAFNSEGIKFKNKTHNIEGRFQIKLWKVFLVEMVDLGIYMNRSKSKMSYFTINTNFSYKHFAAITQKVKNNWDGKSFDAAIGVFYRKYGMEEIVRIFSNSIDEQMTKELKALYDKIITKE